jgi:hypothetical protein
MTLDSCTSSRNEGSDDNMLQDVVARAFQRTPSSWHQFESIEGCPEREQKERSSCDAASEILIQKSERLNNMEALIEQEHTARRCSLRIASRPKAANLEELSGEVEFVDEGEQTNADQQVGEKENSNDEGRDEEGQEEQRGTSSSSESDKDAEGERDSESHAAEEAEEEEEAEPKARRGKKRRASNPAAPKGSARSKGKFIARKILGNAEGAMYEIGLKRYYQAWKFSDIGTVLPGMTIRTRLPRQPERDVIFCGAVQELTKPRHVTDVPGVITSRFVVTADGEHPEQLQLHNVMSVANSETRQNARTASQVLKAYQNEVSVSTQAGKALKSVSRIPASMPEIAHPKRRRKKPSSVELAWPAEVACDHNGPPGGVHVVSEPITQTSIITVHERAAYAEGKNDAYEKLLPYLLQFPYSGPQVGAEG